MYTRRAPSAPTTSSTGAQPPSHKDEERSAGEGEGKETGQQTAGEEDRPLVRSWQRRRCLDWRTDAEYKTKVYLWAKHVEVEVGRFKLT